MDKKIEVAVEKCTENFMLTYCSECPMRNEHKVNHTKECRDRLIVELFTLCKKQENELETAKEIISNLHREINNGK